MYFNENEILRIKSASDGRLLDVVQDFRELRKSGKDYVCECPKCRSAKKFTVSPGKNLFMLNNGACIEAIRELLGHAGLAATQIYTHNSFESLKKVYNQAHPRA